MNDDVDIDKLVEDMEGYFGVEIKGICVVVGVVVYDWFIKEGGMDVGIWMGDLEYVIKN